MSAYPPLATVERTCPEVRFVPLADMTAVYPITSSARARSVLLAAVLAGKTRRGAPEPDNFTSVLWNTVLASAVHTAGETKENDV